MNNEQPMTEEEARSLAAAIDYVKRIDAFASGVSKTCPMCGDKITGAKCYEKIEPETFSLYVLPCECRLGLWSKVPQWITDDGLPIEVIDSHWS